MTAGVDAFPGPPCDICGDELAVLSLLNYTDYAQVKSGLACAPGFLRSIADGIDGRHTAEPEPESAAGELGPDDDSQSAGVSATPAEMDDGPDTGSAKDHWASTTNVRRSTHGHRSTTRRPATARKDEPE